MSKKSNRMGFARYVGVCALCLIGVNGVGGCASGATTDETDGGPGRDVEVQPDHQNPQSCSDGILNGGETDVDCGGPECIPCANGKGCQNGDDCQSGSCVGGLCQPASCADEVQNGQETDVDCGGPDCDPCGSGQGCDVGSDCQSGVCDNGACVGGGCDDTIQNGEETDVDCGGPDCDPCAAGQGCGEPSDCESGVCAAGVCQAAACDDEVQNGEETDVDCGGPDCSGCAVGMDCVVPSDCQSGQCVGGVCQGDVEPPTIVSIVPPDGTYGVSKDIDIVIQFSEPMNTVDTAASFQSSDIPPADVTFSWNPAGDTLTVDPDNDLAYASGTDPATVSALQYTFTITTQAADEAGNPLAAAESSSFYTLREITQSFAHVDGLTGDVRDDATVNGCSGTRICAGDSGVTVDAQYKGFVTFDISALPANIESVVGATLTADQETTFGNPYIDLGDLNLHHVSFTTLDINAFNSAALHDLGTFATNSLLEAKFLDVLLAVADDVNVGRTNSQYRFVFDAATDYDAAFDAALFGKASATLEIVYLLE